MTPLYYSRTLASSCGLSPAPDYHPEVLSQQQLRALRLLQLFERHEGKSSNELPASFIQYTIEWKVTEPRKFCPFCRKLGRSFLRNPLFMHFNHVT